MTETLTTEPALCDLLRSAFRQYAATVSVITYRDSDGRPCGMTATSVCSLSLDPCRILACINRSTRTYTEVRGKLTFGVNVLAARQRIVAMQCSTPGSTKRLDPRFLLEEAPHEFSNPVLKDSLACLDCVVADEHDAVTHTIFIGDVRQVWLNPIQEWPLLYWGGLYRRLESDVAEAERFHWEV